MKIVFALSVALLFTLPSHTGYSQTEGNRMIQGLTKAYETSCNGVAFELWYQPQSDTVHMRDENPADFTRDRLVMIVTNSQPPANRRFALTEPKALPGFARLLKQVGEGWVDISGEQLDPRHTGSASKVNRCFKSMGDVVASTSYYAAFTTIADPKDIERGNYILRLTAFPYLEVDGQPCSISPPDLPIQVR